MGRHAGLRGLARLVFMTSIYLAARFARFEGFVSSYAGDLADAKLYIGAETDPPNLANLAKVSA